MIWPRFVVHWNKFEEVNIIYTPAVSEDSLYPSSSPIILKNQMQSFKTFLIKQIAHKAWSRAYLFVKMKDEMSVDFFMTTQSLQVKISNEDSIYNKLPFNDDM